jgi:hypothetical protein
MATKTLKGMSTPEHTKIFSRTRGVMLEIGVGPHGTSDKDNVTGGLVSKNPFASLAQAGYMHTHPGILGKKGLAEWDASTKGKRLPKRVKK